MVFCSSDGIWDVKLGKDVVWRTNQMSVCFLLFYRSIQPVTRPDPNPLTPVVQNQFTDPSPARLHVSSVTTTPDIHSSTSQPLHLQSHRRRTARPSPDPRPPAPPRVHRVHRRPVSDQPKHPASSQNRPKSLMNSSKLRFRWSWTSVTLGRIWRTLWRSEKARRVWCVSLERSTAGDRWRWRWWTWGSSRGESCSLMKSVYSHQ